MQDFWDLSSGAKVLLALCSIVVLAEGLYLGHVERIRYAEAGRRTCDYMVEKWRAAEPDGAAVKEKYTGPIAKVVFDTRFPDAKNFKSAIEGAAADGANFAGRYAVAEWGCGTNCQDHAVVDVKSGEIVAFGIPSDMGLSLSPTSALLSTNPEQNFPKLADLEKSNFADQVYWFNLPREYYVLEESNGSASVSRLCIENAFEGQGL